MLGRLSAVEIQASVEGFHPQRRNLRIWRQLRVARPGGGGGFPENGVVSGSRQTFWRSIYSPIRRGGLLRPRRSRLGLEVRSMTARSLPDVRGLTRLRNAAHKEDEAAAARPVEAP